MSLPTLWNTKAFNSLLYLKLQEKGKLINTVLRSPGGFGGAEVKFIEQMGPGSFTKITNRLGDTQWGEPDAYRRKMTKTKYEYARILDKLEDLDRLVDPTSKIFRNIMLAGARLIDSVIYEALLGTAYTGEDGGTPTPLPPSQTISAGGADLSVEKLLQAREMLMEANVDPDEPRYMVISPDQITALLNDDKVTSADYNSIRALVRGDIDTFMGFKFIEYNNLDKTGDIRYCVAYVESAAELCIDKNITTTVDRLPTKRNSIGIQGQVALGAVRLEEEKVIKIECDES